MEIFATYDGLRAAILWPSTSGAGHAVTADYAGAMTPPAALDVALRAQRAGLVSDVVVMLGQASRWDRSWGELLPG